VAKDYYQILGIPQEASAEGIKKSYRQLAMQYHPDRNLGNEEWANEKFKQINEAFSVLGDPEKRRRYDQFGTAEEVNIGDVFNSPFTRSAFDDLMRDFGAAGLRFDFLGNIFGSFPRGGGFPFGGFGGGFRMPGGVMFSFSQAAEHNQVDLCIDDFGEPARTKIREAVAEWIQRRESPMVSKERALARADEYLQRPGSISVTWEVIAKAVYQARRDRRV
jgi:DnaJ-class molecular chaperone